MGNTNIMMILADDLGCWALGCAGNEEILTPNIDSLARDGMTFENFFCTSPVCSPARASIATGRIPSQHGVHDWIRDAAKPDGPAGQEVEYLQGMPGTTDVLAKHGYVCGLSGKWHLGAVLQSQQGFDFWEVHASGAGPYHNAPMVKSGEIYTEPRYVTDVITDNAIEFLTKNAENTFYLGVHYTAPHSPWEREHHPAEYFDPYYNDCAFNSVPDLPSHPWQTSKFCPRGDREKRRELLSGYYAAVTAMDANIGRILECLDQLGIRDNTLILFTSDNGMNMGHHGIFGKGNGTFPMNMFETSVKIPMIMCWPNGIQAGSRSDALLSQYDLLPTLLEIAEVDNPLSDQNLPGRSFAALLRNEPLTDDEPVVVFDEYGPVRMIRTKQWKYVHRYPYGPHELYDLVNDPDENRNCLEDQSDIARDLFRQLEAWFVKYVDPQLDGCRQAVTGRGQIARLNENSNEGAPFLDDWVYLRDHGEDVPRTAYSPYNEV